MQYQVAQHVLPTDFYDRPPLVVAPDLIGKLLVRRIASGLIVGMIVETEAYLPAGDAAAHNVPGETKRNRSLYSGPGTAYVHRMRQYHLLDAVTENPTMPGSVLIRAVQPIDGIDTMKSNRGTEILTKLASGPGRLCQAFEITGELDGISLTDPASKLVVVSSEASLRISEIGQTARIGISKAADMQLRFVLSGSQFVSGAA